MRADRLARAAVDAGVGGEAQRRERLLDAAEELDPNCVRVRLERFDDRVDPVVQLEFLQGLETEDPKLVGLIASQACLACLLLGDLDGAETWMGRAQEADPDSIAVGICRVNLEVQRGRLALIADRAFVTAHLLDARDRALGLRERLLTMGRWEESVRLLTMAADVPGLLRDQDAARELLEQARPEEIEARDGASVLGRRRSAGGRAAARAALRRRSRG